MAANARVTILMNAAQKRALAKQAREQGLSVGELIRNRALDPEGGDALLRLVQETTAKANVAIDRAITALENSAAQRAQLLTASREQAHHDFATIDFDLMAEQLFGAMAAGGGIVARP